jgi:DNA-dependent RNA polymerase auxiliary subunit epsilon
LEEDESIELKPNQKSVWLYATPQIAPLKKGQVLITTHSNTESLAVKFEKEKGEWLVKMLHRISIHNNDILKLSDLQADYEKSFEDFELFWFSKVVKKVKEFGIVSC